MKKINNWFEIFRAGKQTDSKGSTREWTIEDLDKIVSSYEPLKHEAPAVIGHPKTDAPAYGWVESVKRVGNTLMAKLKQIEPSFAKMVAEGRFKKRSISLYPDLKLRHIGFLGAAAPAVQGLKDFKNNNNNFETYEFEQQTQGDKRMSEKDFKELQIKLEAEQKARQDAEQKAKEYKAKASKVIADFAEAKLNQKKEEVKNFVAQGIKDGKLLPAWQEQGIEEFMLALDENNTEYEFCEGKKSVPSRWFEDFLQSFSSHELFKKMAKPENDDKNKGDFAEDEKLAAEIAGKEEGK